MATDFWASTHYKRWIVDRASIKQAREDDLRYVDDPEHIDFLAIYFANVITKLCKKLMLRQRVIATATVFFRRFYLKNSYCETDPFMVIAACCYVAAKAEESPVHIKNVVTESRNLFSQDMYGVKNFPSDNSKLAEMEFYLVDDLECDLVVFHPYRTLLALCRKPRSNPNSFVEREAGELGVGMDADDGARYWGSGVGQLELGEGALEVAWFIINDTYRSDLCLLYEPHLIAIAALYLTLILHQPTQSTVVPLLSSHQATASKPSQNKRSSRSVPAQDPITFLADLNVSLPVIANIAQEIISLYTLWGRYKEDSNAAIAQTSFDPSSPLLRTFSQPGSTGATPNTNNEGEASVMTPVFLSSLLVRMREGRLADLAHPATSKPVAINKRLERTQAVG